MAGTNEFGFFRCKSVCTGGGPESGRKKFEKCLPAGTGTKIYFSSRGRERERERVCVCVCEWAFKQASKQRGNSRSPSFTALGQAERRHFTCNRDLGSNTTGNKIVGVHKLFWDSESWKGGKDPHPQDFSLTKKTARFLLRANFVLTKDRKRPYHWHLCGKIHREGSCSKGAGGA